MQRARRTRYPDGLPVGEAVLTTAGNLPARFVIHTVGPIWGADEPADKLLASCYRKAIELVDAAGLAVDRVPGHLDRRVRVPEGPRGGSGVQGDRRGAGARRTRSVRVQLVFFSDAGSAASFCKHQQFPERLPVGCVAGLDSVAHVQIHCEFISGLEQCHERLRDLVSFRGWKIHPTL